MCWTGYSFEYIPSKEPGIAIEFTKCLSHKDLNCYAFVNQNECKICNKGYYLNANLWCEQIHVQTCYDKASSVIYYS